MKFNRRPSLLMVAPSAYVLGGLATWLDYLQPGLDSLGWDVTIGLVEGQQHHRAVRYIKEHPHPRWIPIPCRTATAEGRQRAMIRAIRKLKPDLVATVNIPDAIAAIARMRSRGLPAPKIVITLHGIQADLYDDIRTYRDTLDCVISTNQLSCRLAVELGQVSSDRVLYAPYGVQVPVESPHETNDFDNQPASDNRRLKIAWVGRFEQEQKRVGDILPILTGLAEIGVPFECRIAGAGPDESKLRLDLAEFQTEGRVRFLGRLNPDQLARQVYQSVDAFLLTSVWETGPIVLWEAMGHGLAVVSSRYVGSGAERALCDGQNALLFPVGDTALAVAQLARLWREPGLREQIGANGRRLVQQRYTTQKSIAAWDSVLRRVLEQPECSQPAGKTRVAANGRLDHWLGSRAAESIRQVFRKNFQAAEPGGEWPHSHGHTKIDDPDFWRLAARLDAEKSASEVQLV